MSVNILKYSELYNSPDAIALTRTELTRSDLKKLAGLKEGSISVASLHGIAFEADMHTSVFCTNFELAVSEGTAVVYVYYKVDKDRTWVEATVTRDGNSFLIDFNSVLPDHAQLIYKIKVIYLNMHLSSTAIYSVRLLTVDYPIDFNLVEFSVAASSYNNAPVQVYNKSVQGTAQDIRVLPIFSGDYEQDLVYNLTASGKGDDSYHVQRGYRFPEDAGWDYGRLSASGIETTASGLVLMETAVSGTWTSPVIYIPDPDFISLYVYGDNLSDDAFLGRDFKAIDSLIEVRSCDVSPRPNFLISNWTQRLYTNPDQQSELSLASRRPEYVGYTDVPTVNSAFWAADKIGVCGGSRGLISPCPFIIGRSKRMYVKGDGNVLAMAPDDERPETLWEYGHRGCDLGIPYKEFGDINSFWNAGHLVSLLGQWSTTQNGACTMSYIAADRRWYRMTFATESDSSDWAEGRDAGYKLIDLYPYNGHYDHYYFGVAQEPILAEPIGSMTFSVDRHPNEWISVVGTVYPWNSTPKYMCLYYTHVRNFWPIESKTLGCYGVGDGPSDEGWAMCKAKSVMGFWLHVGYMPTTIAKYNTEGNVIHSTRTGLSFNSIEETVDPAGVWAVRNDSIYWYEETSSGLTERFSITDSRFLYLQMGGVDNYNNLWVIDRDTTMVYRINFSTRSIDYAQAIPYVVAVWPHPRDGSAYIYTSFNASTFSTAISRIDVNDSYNYVDFVMALPEMPLSDYSGVQFKGRTAESFMKPPINDPVWGTADDLSLVWQTYPNASLSVPEGKYKQFRVTLQRSLTSISSPAVQRVRIPKSLVLKEVPYGDYKNVYINPHLRYNKKYGHFSTELIVWWPHV